MYELLNKHIDDVKLIRTDGFLCTDHTKFKSVLKKDASIGCLVLEGAYENITINKVNSTYSAENGYKFIQLK